MISGVTEEVFLELLSCEYKIINKTHNNIAMAYFHYTTNNRYRAQIWGETENCLYFNYHVLY